MAMFSSFRAYDDEGYYLASLNDYLTGHPVVTEYAQVYGPFFYEFFGGLFRLLGAAPVTDTGRLVTGAAWLIASVLTGVVAFRLTRNLVLAIAVELLTFGLLVAITNEPMATYGLVDILLIVVVGAATFREGRPRASAVVIGAAVAALCLIKINVGGLTAIAILLAWAAGLRGRVRLLTVAVTFAATALIPFLLMSALLASDGWVRSYALVVSLSIAAVGVACLFDAPQAQLPPSFPWLVGGGAAVAALSVGVALAGGVRVGDLWSGLVVAPLKFPQLFIVAFAVGPAHLAAALLSLGAVIVLSVRGQQLTGLVRVTAGFFTLASLVWMPNAIFMLAVPLAWMTVRPPDGNAGRDPVGSYARVVIAALAVLQTMQAYPIAGTQASMAGLCLVPAGALILGDGLGQFAASGGRRIGRVAPTMLALDAIAIVVLAVTTTAAFAGAQPVDLPGARQLRLPVRQATDVRELVAAIDANCSSFITLPSMSSLYIWTEQSPPTPIRVPIWWLIATTSQQQSAVQLLEHKPRVCLVANAQVLGMRSMGRPLPSTPLVDYIRRSFVRQGTYGDYELLVRAGS